ncbi:hypothetical protein TSUD_46810 [Trifolium subterraneum]|nr:hypothetical protein TSUD_46810 [Trifolium subterraneum]
MQLDLESLSEATSGAIGSLVSTTVLYPLDTCKTKYQAEVQAKHQRKYRRISDVLWEAISKRQVLSLYQGLGTKNVQSFISSFIYFYGYSYFKKLYLKTTGNKNIGTTANLIAATMSGSKRSLEKFNIWHFLYTKNHPSLAGDQPLDTASSRMQTSEFGKSKGLWETLSEGSWSEAYDGLAISILLTTNPSIQAADSYDNKGTEAERKAQKTISGALYTIWKREGLLGFFNGLQAQILKTVLSSALLLMVKEKIAKSTWILMLMIGRYFSTNPSKLKAS